MSDVPLFDFIDYIQSYTGREKLLRIHHMVTKGLLEEEDELVALQMAFEELTNGTPKWRLQTDYKFLEIISNLINGRLGQQYIATPEILKRMESLYIEELDKRNYRLRYAMWARDEEEEAKNQCRMENPEKRKVMESLRHQLGRYQYHSGHLEEAFDTLSKLPVCILLVISALHCRKFEEVCILSIKLDTYAPKLDDGDDRKAIHFKSLCARGLANMARGHYYAAAVLFAHMIKFYVKWSTYTFELFAWEDIILYCTWCGLATMPREELEDIAKHMGSQLVGDQFQHLIREYLGGRFDRCLEFMVTHSKPKALLDIYLHEHVNALGKLIEDKLIVEPEAAPTDD
ncbi:unnamed protein product [Arabidopsis lyrata]|nr:unnamed protein product [Arabidopsis lyrata]